MKTVLLVTSQTIL